MNKFPCPSCNKIMVIPDGRKSLLECKICLIGFDKLMEELYTINPTSYNEYSIESRPSLIKGTFDECFRKFKLKALL